MQAQGYTFSTPHENSPDFHGFLQKYELYPEVFERKRIISSRQSGHFS